MPRKNFTQDLAHPHPGAVLDAFCAAEQQAAPVADYCPQAHGNFAQRSRWHDKYDQAGLGAVA